MLYLRWYILGSETERSMGLTEEKTRKEEEMRGLQEASGQDLDDLM